LSSAAEIPDHSAADRNALARRRSTRCRCRCDQHAVGLLRAPAEEGHDIAARENVIARAILAKSFVGEAASFPFGKRDADSISYRLFSAQLSFELLFALVQRLQSQLPAMQLNGELIDVAGDFSPL